MHFLPEKVETDCPILYSAKNNYLFLLKTLPNETPEVVFYPYQNLFGSIKIQPR